MRRTRSQSRRTKIWRRLRSGGRLSSGGSGGSGGSGMDNVDVEWEVDTDNGRDLVRFDI